MPLPIPNLDDRSFDDLMKEAKSLIPIYNREWTNHNPSDPGITLLELFAWLCEMMIYRINQVPEENYRKFLELIGIEYLFNWDQIPEKDDDRLREFLIQNYDVRWVRAAKIEKSYDEKTITVSAGANFLMLKLNDQGDQVTMTFADGRTYELVVKKKDDQLKDEQIKDNQLMVYETIERDIRRGVKAINQRYRAITSDDFESLALECMENLQKGLSGRAMCMNNRDLQYQKKTDDPKLQAGHVSVVIIPRGEGYVFTWERVLTELEKKLEEEELLILREFLMQIYDAAWVRDAIIEKSVDGKTLSISYESSFIKLELNEPEEKEEEEKKNEEEKKKKVIMISNIYRSSEYELMVGTIVIIPRRVGTIVIILREEEYVFTWEKVPGEDEHILREFLMQIYNAAWVRDAIIEKNEDGKTISISYKSNFIKLELNEGEKKVIMTSNFSPIYRSGECELMVDGTKVKGYCAGKNEPSDLLMDQVKKYLNKRRLITTRVHVVPPDYWEVMLTVNVTLKGNTVKETVITEAEKRINKYFSPLDGGQDGKGWPLGRSVYRSEIYQLLEGITGVDHVESVKIIINDSEIMSSHQLILITGIIVEVGIE